VLDLYKKKPQTRTY